MQPQNQYGPQPGGWTPQANTAAGPMPQPQAYQGMPAQQMPQEMGQGQTVADLTVPKKGVGLKIILALSVILLIGTATFYVMSIVDANSMRAQIADLEAQVKDKEDKIKIALEGLSLSDEEELNQETLDRIRSEGASRLNIDFAGLSVSHIANWIKISADGKTMLADVNIGGTGYYYYRSSGNDWKMAYSYASTVACRSVTKDAMQAVVSMGLEKKTGANGVKYDCIDTASGDKMYSFEDAIKAEVFKSGSNTSTSLDGQTYLDLESNAASSQPKSTSPKEDALRLLDK